MKVIYIALTIIFYFVFSKFISKYFDKLKIKHRKYSNLIDLLKYSILFSLVVFFIVLILDEFGINLLPIISSLGILSFLVTFTLKDVINNIASGFLLSIDPPFKINDFVEIDGIRGKVIEISLRNIKIDTGIYKISIPSSNILGKTIKNYEKEVFELRIKIKKGNEKRFFDLIEKMNYKYVYDKIDKDYVYIKFYFYEDKNFVFEKIKNIIDGETISTY